MLKHVENLGMTLHDDRAEAAPRLSCAHMAVRSEDTWVETETQAVRRHARPRTTLFTPLRVAGAPPAKALTAMRVTEGQFCDTGEKFVVTDNWAARSTAHASLERLWAGEARFWRRSERQV